MSNSHHHKRGANVNGDVTSERSQDDTWGTSNDGMCDTQDQQQNLQQPSQRRKIERRTRWRTVGWIKRTSKGSAWQARDKMLIRGTEWIRKIDFCHDGDPLIKCHSSESTDAAAWTDMRSTRIGGNHTHRGSTQSCDSGWDNTKIWRSRFDNGRDNYDKKMRHDCSWLL